MQLRKACAEDMDDVMQIFSQARLAQRRAGFKQWEDHYPSVEILKSDINNSTGFIFDDNGNIAGYVAIATNDEEYNRHNELWNTDKPYAVFHRIAISDAYRGKKLSGELVQSGRSQSPRIRSCFSQNRYRTRK